MQRSSSYLVIGFYKFQICSAEPDFRYTMIICLSQLDFIRFGFADVDVGRGDLFLGMGGGGG